MGFTTSLIIEYHLKQSKARIDLIIKKISRVVRIGLAKFLFLKSWTTFENSFK
jgi:hypothetical protein